MDEFDLAEQAGRPVRFRFRLSGGRLYAFWVTPDPKGASGGYLAAGSSDHQSVIDRID